MTLITQALFVYFFLNNRKMGAFISGMKGYIHLFYMNTYDEIGFQEELNQWLETAKASGQFQTFAQYNALQSGLHNPSSSPWSVGGWLSISSTIKGLSPIVIPAMAGLAFLVYATKLNQLAMFFSVFFLFFWLMYLFQTLLPGTSTRVNTPYPFLISIVTGLVGGAVVNYGFYAPYLSENENQKGILMPDDGNRSAFISSY